MSKVLEKIKKEQMKARKEKDTVKKNLLTTVIGEASTSGNEGVAKDSKVLKVINTFINNLHDMIKNNEKRGRDTSKEKQEIEILEPFMPDESEKLSEEQIEQIAKQFIEENDIQSMKQMRDVMDYFSDNYPFLYDGQKLSAMVSKILKGQK